MAFSFSTEGIGSKPEKGLLKITSGKCQKFHPDSSSRVYLIILYLDMESRFKIICQRHEIPRNRNVVVTHSGEVKLTKIKSTWEDEHGHDHSDDANKVLNYSQEFETVRKKYENEVSAPKMKHKMKVFGFQGDTDSNLIYKRMPERVFLTKFKILFEYCFSS
ncbi:unnamed protein product [Mytilus coruscus]|uniref:Uncharacterized protein n=1 Tax=Mytilus coruscus TaxID=42192 RepID=A0A6J8A9J2_MYTCO|nr:unnamed protein product [Mytilus coruscus]